MQMHKFRLSPGSIGKNICEPEQEINFCDMKTFRYISTINVKYRKVLKAGMTQNDPKRPKMTQNDPQ